LPVVVPRRPPDETSRPEPLALMALEAIIIMKPVVYPTRTDCPTTLPLLTATRATSTRPLHSMMVSGTMVVLVACTMVALVAITLVQ